jgi:hypothetical protein
MTEQRDEPERDAGPEEDLRTPLTPDESEKDTEGHSTENTLPHPQPNRPTDDDSEEIGEPNRTFK